MWLKIKEHVCLCMFEKGGGGSGNRDFDSHELFYVFLFLKEKKLCSCFMRPLSPQAKVAPKNWDFAHKGGKIWQNFLKLCAKKFQPLILI